MAERNLLIDRDGHVVVVTLNRPERLNALDWGLRLALEELWGELADDRDLRCVVVTGAGRGFCAGADVDDLAGEREPRGVTVDDELAFLPGRQLEVPVLVAVNGVCAGGGLHFVADADLVIAGRSASFLDPHLAVGQVSGIEPASLALRLPLAVVNHLVLLGRAGRIDAERARELGLVSEVVEDGALRDRARELATVVAAASPAAVRATRAILRRLESEVVEPAMTRGWEAVQAHWGHPDAVEGPKAFQEQRDPNWRDA